MMSRAVVIQELMREVGDLISLPKDESGLQALAGKINELLNSDFPRLISVLYRMDINETKLRQLLKDNAGIDAGQLIADLMIERQLEKIKTRRESDSYRTKQRDNDIDENEKW